MRQLQDDLRADKRTLHTEARMELAERDASARLLIVVDQFEELFTLCRDDQERSQFLDNVLYAATISQGQTAVIIAMRADFYVRSARMRSSLIACRKTRSRSRRWTNTS